MCKVFKVDRSSYYHWIKAGYIVKKEDTQLNKLIEAIFIQGRRNYGTQTEAVNMLPTHIRTYCKNMALFKV